MVIIQERVTQSSLLCQTEAVANPGSLCKIFIIAILSSPEGVIACVVKNGQYLGIWEPGQHFCLPWTEAQYLITKQNIVFDQPVTSCPTSDNIFVQVISYQPYETDK